MRFEKWQALGNDYLIVESDELPFALTPARVRRLCDGHFGPGADGVLLLSRATDPKHVADLRIFNPDGSEAELSGNGAREAILYLRRRGWTELDEFTIGTAAGEIRPTVTGVDTCRVDMGRASLTSKDFPNGPPDGHGELDAGGRTWRFRHVSIGNPQCAIRVDSLEELMGLDLGAIGPEIEGSQLFPNRTNVSWYTEVTSDPAKTTSGAGAAIRVRIYERGVGETLASGTGSTGAAIAYVLDRHEREDDEREDVRSREGAEQAQSSGRVDGPAGRVEVLLDGGELEVEIGDGLHVNLTGWARPVYKGRLSDELVRELGELEEVGELDRGADR
jgi:diaminopimelate epimerase